MQSWLPKRLCRGIGSQYFLAETELSNAVAAVQGPQISFLAGSFALYWLFSQRDIDFVCRGRDDKWVRYGPIQQRVYAIWQKPANCACSPEGDCALEHPDTHPDFQFCSKLVLVLFCPVGTA